LKPEQAKAYLEREANVHENLEQLLSDIARTTDWDTQAFDAYGRLVVESGIRYAHTQAEWARWAAEQVDGLSAPNKRASKVGVGQSG
jgi:hypothetical protein